MGRGKGNGNRNLTPEEIKANERLAKSTRELAGKFAAIGDTDTARQAQAMSARASQRAKTGKAQPGRSK